MPRRPRNLLALLSISPFPIPFYFPHPLRAATALLATRCDASRKKARAVEATRSRRKRAYNVRKKEKEEEKISNCKER